ncbi:MAG: hypothetical protein Q9163_006195 [Psora crenata]
MPGKPFAGKTARLIIKPSNSTGRRPTITLVIRPPEGGPPTALRTQVCGAFNEAQKTTAAHRQLAVSLSVVLERCAGELLDASGDVDVGVMPELEGFGEDDFRAEFMRCVVLLLQVKKSEGVGDILAMFVGVFLRHANEKGIPTRPPSEREFTQFLPETAGSRLTTHVLSTLLRFLPCKEKTVRLRATHLMAHIIISLETVDEDCYHLLKLGLMERLRDKEAIIRVQAVVALARFVRERDHHWSDGLEGIDEDDSCGLLEELLIVLQHDPSADVRRSLMLSIPSTPVTLPYILERARDTDVATRRALYTHVLPALGDFRHLSLLMREKLLRWGLRDRDEQVRNATACLFRGRWIEDCGRQGQLGAEEVPTDGIQAKIDALLELLARIDIMNSGDEDNVACEAMREFWAGRPDYREEVRFPDAFWDDLTPESAFLARTLNDYYCGMGDACYCGTNDANCRAVVEEKMPEATKLAFFIQGYTNKLLESLQSNQALREGEDEEDTVEQEFIIEQLLHIALTMDFSDEMGRRKMFALLRETIAIAELPDEITKLAIEVLRNICGPGAANEREFCGVVLEAVAEVHDAIVEYGNMEDNEDESFHSACSELSESQPTKPEALDSRGNAGNEEAEEAKAIRQIVVHMKCLHMAQCMLQIIAGDLQQNMHLVAMLNNLVVPAVRSHEAPIRERGLLCLGLCCLLDKNLAAENLMLFQHCFMKGHNALQVNAVYILTDILETHPSLLIEPNTDPDRQKSILRVFSKGIKAYDTPEVHSATTTALTKLMLASVIKDEDLLRQAVICFFDPATKDNDCVRQALSYFLPTYCHTRRENMEQMAKVAGAVMHAVVKLSEGLEEGEDMVGVSAVGHMLADWTDARKIVVRDGAGVHWDEAGKNDNQAINGDIHLVLAESLLGRALHHGCSREEKRAVIGILGRLYVTPNSAIEKLQSTKDLVTEAIDNKIAIDAASRTALNKLHLSLGKALSEAGKSQPKVDTPVSPIAEDGLNAVHGDGEGGQASSMALTVEEEGNGKECDSVMEELLDDEDDMQG